ncbi:MAG: hypothetical protein IAE80_06490 [Anaerolinea sp.]|nr:hypothetical protein [Anaerolinea sp.]
MIGMSYAERLEKGLIACARHYAPRLVPPDWQQTGDYRRPLPELAHLLGGYGVLVMVGDVPPSLAAQAALHHREWVENYKGLYTLIAGVLFPTFRNVQAFYIDQTAAPPIVGLQGDAIPVIEMLAGYVTPFVAARQGVPGQNSAAEVELIGLMDMILEELEASDFPRETYKALRDNGAAYIRQILIGYTRQIALTPALRPVFGDSTQPTPPQVPPRLDATQGAPSFNTQTIAPPPPPIHSPTVLPPSVLPEEDRISLAPPPTQVPDEPLFKTGSIPVFFDSGKRDKGTRRPPVPNLPE